MSGNKDVFIHCHNQPESASWCAVHLDALMKGSGMRYFRLHDMRHFFASLLLAQGVELKVVSDLLGHASIQITADTYAHLMPKIKEQAIDLLDDVLTGIK
jgi:integrase